MDTITLHWVAGFRRMTQWGLLRSRSTFQVPGFGTLERPAGLSRCPAFPKAGTVGQLILGESSPDSASIKRNRAQRWAAG